MTNMCSDIRAQECVWFERVCVCVRACVRACVRLCFEGASVLMYGAGV